MWRAFFLAVGLYGCLLGAECLVVDRAVLREKGSPTEGRSWLGVSAVSQREFVPPEWAPWGLMSVGAVTILYSFTIPRWIVR
jgi:hypothetical protein